MTYGQQTGSNEAFAILDRSVDFGIDFIDAAEMYPIPPKRETQGATETILGDWFAARGRRSDVILATKVCGRSTNDWFRDDGAPTRLTRPQIFEAVEKSLRRLRTDYIDLYQIHWPDRVVSDWGTVPSRFKPFVPRHRRDGQSRRRPAPLPSSSPPARSDISASPTRAPTA